MRTILHCDCNAFFASCEEADNGELKNVPMAVGGNEKTRHGIILAKNEIAKGYGKSYLFCGSKPLFLWGGVSPSRYAVVLPMNR